MTAKPHEGPAFRSGYVAIVGAPNAGKSTLLNRVLGQKISIVSSKPQTTRQRILGILNRPDAQAMFLDTPGILRESSKRLNACMQAEAWACLADADVAVLLADMERPDVEGDRAIASRISESKARPICGLNKVDAVDRGSLAAAVEAYRAMADFDRIIPMSALTGEGVDQLEAAIVAALPEGPAYYPPDAATDVTERFVAAEIVREKIFEVTRQEIPYSAAVEVTRFAEPAANDEPTHIEADIWVERDSQKGIVIGAGGSMIKRIGTLARLELEAALDRRIVLKLFVKVKKDWTRDPQALKELGYKD